MLAGSAISSSMDSMPGFASTVLARLALRRPEMMTLFPRSCNASASALPIPEPPPVMKIVFQVSFISFLLLFEINPESHSGLQVSDAKDSGRELCAPLRTFPSQRHQAGLEW